MRTRPRALDLTVARDVERGLSLRPRSIPSKYLYDGAGSLLFERICELPEYYLTRTEVALLARAADEIARSCEPDELVELGPGSTRKARLLLAAMCRGRRVRYVPIDVSSSMLALARRTLSRAFPSLTVAPIETDFLSGLDVVPRARGRRLVAFLGSTLGNLEDREAAPLLRNVRALLGPDDRFLLGADLVKERAVIERAYDDASGVTAAFNRNALAVVSRALDGDARPELFDHVAAWSEADARIEMRLRARATHVVRFAAIDLEVPLREGEWIRTEISRKWTRRSLEALLGGAGLAIERWLTDERGWYVLALARPRRAVIT